MSQEDNQPELKHTQVPITIRTPYTYNSDADRVRQQINQTSYYLNAIFWFMKTAVEGSELLKAQTNHVLYQHEDFQSNVQFLAEIGAGLSEQLTLYSCAIKESDEGNKFSVIDQEIEKENPAEGDFDCGTVDSADGDRLAEVISAVLQNPNLPDPIYEAIKTGMNDVYNSMNQHELTEYEESPEYIAKVLKGWRGETSGGE